MDFETRFEELKIKEIDETLITDLLSLQEEAFQANDAEIYLKTSHLLFDSYVQLGETDQATSLFLSMIESPEFESYQTNVGIIDKLIGLLLKTEDFNALKSVLSLRERYLPAHPEHRLMQSFYRAVCYEGLKDYDQAIHVLQAITDTISHSNLVSKYLKLAMLFIKINDLSAAKGAYDRALIFDKKKKNDMFYLVASDLDYAQGLYSEALKEFETFFLKTPIKTRYLDRYLWICIKLEKWSEAWTFYKTYLPKMNQTLSKNYRLTFYQAGLELAKRLNQVTDQWMLSEAIASLSQSKAEITDSFEGIQTLLTSINDSSLYQTKRDVILKSFRNLAELIDVDRLIYVASSLDGLIVYTYRKGLLMEKTYLQAVWSSTILNTVITSDQPFHLFTQEDCLKETDYVTMKPFMPHDYAQILSYRIESMKQLDGYMLVFLKNDRTYDYVNRLTLTVQKLLIHHLTVYKQLSSHQQSFQLVNRLLDRKQLGLLKICDNLVFFENDVAKTMLKGKNDFITFEEFQSKMVHQTVYLDEFLRKQSLHLQLSISSTLHDFDCQIWLIDRDIFVLIEDVSETIAQNKALNVQVDHHPFNHINTLIHLQKQLQMSKSSQTIMGFWFLEKQPMKSIDSSHRTQWMIETLHRLSKSHLKSICYDDGGFFILLGTIDKRIIDRLYKDLETEWNQIRSTSRFETPGCDIRASFYTITAKDDLQVLLKNLRQTLWIDPQQSGLYPYNRGFISQWNQLESLYQQYLDFQSSKKLPLHFSPMVNVLTKKTELFLAEIDESALIGEKTLWPVMLRYYHLEADYGFSLLDRIFQILMTLQKKEEKTIAVMLDLSSSVFFEEKRLEDWFMKCKRNKLSLSQFYIRIDEPLVFEQAESTLKNLKEKGVHWVIRFPKFKALELLERYTSLIDFSFVNATDSLFQQPALINLFHPSHRIYLMVGEINDLETMALMKSYQISLMMGSLFQNKTPIELTN